MSAPNIVTPIVQNVNAFDATSSHIFYFTSVGGNQVVKNTLTIRNNATNVVVYTNTLETYSFNQSVPADTLTNGTYYNYYFNTYDIDDNMSANSNVIGFYCYTSPTVTFTNIPTGNIINNSAYLLDVTYDQIEDELLASLTFSLHDATTNELIMTSAEYYSTDVPPVSFSHYFTGFEDAKSYYVSANAISINGTTSTSGLIEVVVKYNAPLIFTANELENMCNEGYVKESTNIILVDGVATPSPPTYVESNTMVEVMYINEANVIWSNGFSIGNNFIMRVKYKPCLDSTIGGTIFIGDFVSGSYFLFY